MMGFFRSPPVDAFRSAREAMDQAQWRINQLQAERASKIAEADSERRILEQSAKIAETKAAKEEDKEERQQLRHEAKTLAKELAAHVVPESPLMLCDDETPEDLGRLLTRHGGRMLLASAEGTIFEMAKSQNPQRLPRISEEIQRGYWR